MVKRNEQALRESGEGLGGGTGARHEAEDRIRIENLTRELEEHQARLAQLQDQLMLSEKMAAIGQLAAGVAHEINNPVGYVHSNIGSLERYMRDFLAVLDAYERAEPSLEDAARQEIRRLKQEVDFDFLRQDVEAMLRESCEGLIRVRGIVQDLKDFSHVDRGAEWKLENLHAGLESTLNVIRNELKYKCTVEKEYGALPPVECLLPELNQVFMNLLVNAAHAIEKQGSIRLRTGVAGDRVWVEVGDTGKGIAPENLARIFEPFFTTKPKGKGTGLGLSISRRIIHKHHGEITVDSTIDAGAVFRVWLPVRQPAA